MLISIILVQVPNPNLSFPYEEKDRLGSGSEGQYDGKDGGFSGKLQSCIYFFFVICLCVYILVDINIFLVSNRLCQPKIY